MTLENFAKLYEMSKTAQRDLAQPNSMPFLIASTLIVPGYITADEIHKIASFIARLVIVF